MAKRIAAPELKLVCKCGSCTHWEIVLNTGTGKTEGEQNYAHQYLVCVKCGGEFACYFEMGPARGLALREAREGRREERGRMQCCRGCSITFSIG